MSFIYNISTHQNIKRCSINFGLLQTNLPINLSDLAQVETNDLMGRSRTENKMNVKNTRKSKGEDVKIV